MTVKIKYTGPSDARELASADLKKVGVEGFIKTSFAKGEVVEVDKAVSEALLENPELFGTFSDKITKADEEVEMTDDTPLWVEDMTEEAEPKPKPTSSKK